MRITKPTLKDVLYVVENMREWDRKGAFITRWSDDSFDFAEECVKLPGLSYVAHGEHPAAVFGATPMWPGVWSAWLFGTDEVSRLRFSLTRHIRRVMMPAIAETGAHRVESRSLVGNPVETRWREAMGARREAVLAGYGRNGEDVQVYVWERADGHTRSVAAGD